MGTSGQELTQLLRSAGVARSDCSLTNVLLERPPGNNLKEFCCPLAEAKAGYQPEELRQQWPAHPWPDRYNWPSLGQQMGYLRPERLGELARLREEISAVRPNVVVALGATACWALLRSPKISQLRGTFTYGESQLKVLPTFHPAYVLRNYASRPIVIADLMKAKQGADSPTIRRPARQLWLDPTLEDLAAFDQHVQASDLLAVDIETKGGLITHVGFAPSARLAICIPFWTGEGSYWEEADEPKAWQWVRRWCESPVPKVLQNGLYDLQYLWRTAGITLRNYLHDTMLMHHSLQPQLPKSLGFLGSVYTEEPTWKHLRIETEKRED